MSDSRGVFVKVNGSSDSNVAGINVNAAFFAPAISICPDSDLPPRTTMESMPVTLSFQRLDRRLVEGPLFVAAPVPVPSAAPYWPLMRP